MTFAPPIRSRPRPGAIALVLAWLLLLGVLAAGAGYILMAPGQLAQEQTAPEHVAEGPGTGEPPEPVLAAARSAEHIPESPEPAAAPEPESAPEPAPVVEAAPVHIPAIPEPAAELPEAEAIPEPEPEPEVVEVPEVPAPPPSPTIAAVPEPEAAEAQTDPAHVDESVQVLLETVRSLIG